MQKKTFDPRSTKLQNPFVQAYLEKQEAKAKPIGDRQKIVNIILASVVVLNLTVLGILAWSNRTTIVPHFLGGSESADATMGEAMQKIKALEITVQNMRNSVEYHKNAYYKIEQEHETMKAAIARTMPNENLKDILASYPTQPAPAAIDPADAAEETAQTTKAVQAARDAAVAAQQTTSQTQ